MKHNPFSTRRIEAGKIPFYYGKESFSVFKPGDFPENHGDKVKNFRDTLCTRLYQKFVQDGYRSQINGNHGTGKTTLLYELKDHLIRRGHELNHVSLHDNQRRLCPEFLQRQKELTDRFTADLSEQRPIAIIDGYEQLSLFQQIKVRSRFRPEKSGLIITAHKPIRRINVLFQTNSTLETLVHVLDYLFEGRSNERPPMELCRKLFERHQGNIRNILFELYDVYESQEEP